MRWGEDEVRARHSSRCGEWASRPLNVVFETKQRCVATGARFICEIYFAK